MARARKRHDQVAAELSKLSRRRGFLTPAQVVAAASNPASPLHDRFQWDDTVAAHQYRLWQARELIASVEFEPTPGRKSFRAFVHLQVEGQKEGRYMNTIDALADPAARKAVLARALLELETVAAKYDQLQELASVWRAIRKANT